MSFQLPFTPIVKRLSPQKHKPLHTSDRSPAANPLRQYGPFVTLAKMVVKGLSLGALGFGISMLIFAALEQQSSLVLLWKIWQAAWKPLATLALCLGTLAAIEDSFR